MSYPGRCTRGWYAATALLAAGLISGCGGGATFGDTGAGGGDGGGEPSMPVIQIGLLQDGAFQPGVLDIGQSPLAAGGSTGLRINIVDTANGNALVTDEVSVTFSSLCASGDENALAVIDPPQATTTSGTAVATYRAQGCEGTETITAQAVIGGVLLSASGVIEVSSAQIGSIAFVSATPETIGIRGAGSGLPESSVVSFRVVNSAGGGVPNQTVSFSLNSTVGGIELEPASATAVTDTTGLASITVRSGNVHTAVRVTATAVREGISVSSQSGLLTITTGVPDQNSFSLSAECTNIEGLSRDGETTDLTLRAADRFNNPAPDGTPIAFTTEGGAVVGNCSTVDGACSVEFRSQNPRPLTFCDTSAADTARDCEDDAESSVISLNGALRGGRATVLATSIGEESFVDADGDGRFDAASGNSPDDSWVDLAEAFRDDDEDGLRDTGGDPSGLVEEIVDFNQNGSFDAADGLFNGVLCDPANAQSHCSPRTLSVRESITIVMSGSSPVLRQQIDPTFRNGDLLIGSGVSYDNGTYSIEAGKVGFIGFVIRDVNRQPMAAGTKVELSAANAGSVASTSSFTLPCSVDDSAQGNIFGFSIKASDPPDPPEDKSGLVELKVTSPSGLVSVFGFGLISKIPETAP